MNEFNKELKEKEEEKEDIDLMANLDQCHESCLDGLMHSLDEGGDFVVTEHIRWLLDCAEICQMSSNFVIRRSEYAGDLLSICAFICEDCAESCETFFEDQHMKDCALTCRSCATACRNAIEEEEIQDMAEEEDEEE